MGVSESKGQVIGRPGKGPQNPVVSHEPPYPGPTAQYTFVNTEVMMSTMVSFNFMQNSMVTSNVDAYYPLLAQHYSQGFRLLSFYHIPGQVQRAGGLFSRDVVMPFQGIFCRYPTHPTHEVYQLKIEKSVIQPQIVWNGFISTQSDIVTDIKHLFQTIANNTQNGGRLICIELTGQEQVQHTFSLREKLPVMGCDLFFEIPVSGVPVENYVYNVVSAPMTVSYHAGLRNTAKVHCDWGGILGQQLAQGWKLVEIFMDQTQSAQGGFSNKLQINCQWFFEKPAPRVNDPTPMYQGTVVEHMITISQSGISGVKTTANWEPVIQNMGNQGWELACILETPETSYSGFASVTAHMKVLLFFQRKIMTPGRPHVAMDPPHSQASLPPGINIPPSIKQ